MTWSQFLANIIGIFKWWIIVTPWEAGVRVFLGKHQKTLVPGIHRKIPGLDRVYIQSVRRRTLDLGIQTISTKDGKVVTLSAIISYHIFDIEKMYNTVHNPEDTLSDLTCRKIASLVFKERSEDLLPEKIEKDFGTINFEEYGLRGVEIGIIDFAFVKTYRLIQDARRYSRAEWINMEKQAGDIN